MANESNTTMDQTANAAELRKRRQDAIMAVMQLYRDRRSVNALRIYVDVNAQLPKPDRFAGEAEFLAFMAELVKERLVDVARSDGDRAEQVWFVDPTWGVPITDEDRQAATDRMLARSHQRLRDLSERERNATTGKAAKIATILATVKALAARNLSDGLSIFRHISLADHSGAIRPSSQDEFRAILFEMIHTGQLAVIGGGLDSPLNKLHIRAVEYSHV
ncbi:MAG: hypothetical protein ABSB42_00570 [Tepidisphaeraceae bacterium]